MNKTTQCQRWFRDITTSLLPKPNTLKLKLYNIHVQSFNHEHFIQLYVQSSTFQSPLCTMIKVYTFMYNQLRIRRFKQLCLQLLTIHTLKTQYNNINDGSETSLRFYSHNLTLLS